jgi:hypothetical protein
MKKISAEIVADSIDSRGNRITSFLLTYPRFIHGEIMTHRMFSRNSASSRAIPFNKMVKMVEEDPFIPIAWQKDHKGMQGTEYIENEYTTNPTNPGDNDLDKCVEEWLYARNGAVLQAKELNQLGVTKQLCNRFLEPFMWHTVLVTATEYDNFFELRCPKYKIAGNIFRSKKDARNWCNSHKDATAMSLDTSPLDWLKINESQAEIHIQKIAEMMWDAMNESTPKELKPGEWHTPFVEDLDMTKVMSTSDWLLNETSQQDSETLKLLPLKIATARAARISYTTLGDNPKIDYEADIKLHDRLLESKHASPLEHCAQCQDSDAWYANFKGWQSYRNKLGL